jgi:hypothetical protein
MNVCMLTTFICASYFLIVHIVAAHHNIYYHYIAIGLSSMQVISYLLCALVNPGIVSAKSPPVDKESLICEVQ